MLRAGFISLVVVTVPALAFAQTPAATTTAAATATAAPAAPAGQAAAQAGGGAANGGAAANGDAPAAADDKKAPARAATGYGYGGGASKPAPVGAPRPRGPRWGGPVATYPGFETTADGGSRVFVQLSQQVAVEERRAAGSITYVLKGARVNVWNNHNALVTVHFNTPVTRARLLSVGADTHLVVELRGNATPTFNVAAAPSGGAVLSVVFPKGDFITGNEETDADNAAKARAAAQATAPEPKKAPKKK